MSYMSRIDEFLGHHAKGQSWADIARDMQLGVEQVRRLARKARVDNAAFGRAKLIERNARWHDQGRPVIRPPRLPHHGRNDAASHVVSRTTLPPLPSLLVPLPVIRGE